jgi:hypothetical protein
MKLKWKILHIFIASLLIFSVFGVNLSVTADFSSSEMPYFYFKLSDDERIAYDAVRAAALDFKKSVDTTPALSDESMGRVAGLLLYYDADTYNVSRVDYDSNSKLSRFTLSYNCTEAAFETMNAELGERVNAVVKSVSAQKSSYSKLVAIHDAIVKNCAITASADRKNKSNMYGALVEKRANSFGYAEAFTYIAGKCGITSFINISIPAGGKTTVAWNKVYIDGRWYNIDCAANDTPGRFRETPSYGLFMVPDAYLSEFTPYTKYFIAPVAETGGMYYYRATGQEAADNTAARKLIADAIVANNKTKRSTVSFTFADDAALEDFITTVSTTYYIVDTLDLVKKYVKNPIITDAADFTVNKKTRVVTIAIFYPETKLSDYYTDISGFTPEQLEYYKDLGLAAE